MSETKAISVSFNLINAIPEIQLIQLLMDASRQLDINLSVEEKCRAIRYFNDWNEQQNTK